MLPVARNGDGGAFTACEPPREYAGLAFYPGHIREPVDDQDAEALKTNPKAWKFFQTLAPSYRRRFVGWELRSRRHERRVRGPPEVSRPLSVLGRARGVRDGRTLGLPARRRERGAGR